MSLRGNQGTIDLVDLLSHLHASGSAGTLRLQIGERSTKLHFFRGQIYLPTGGSSGAYKIGALLVRAGKLTGRDLLRALALQKQEGHQERLGDLLVRMGRVTRADLDQVIRAQFEDQICDLLFERDAEYEFRKDVLPAGFADARGNIQALGFDIRSILMEASRRQDEWRRIRAEVRSGRAVLCLATVASGQWHVGDDGKVSQQAAEGGAPRKLEELEAAVVARWRASHALFEQNPFDGVKTIDEVVAASGLPAFEAMGLVAELRREGLVRELTGQEVEHTVLAELKAGRPRNAYQLFEWANETDHLRATASRLDTVLLRSEHLDGNSFAGRTSSVRALQVLSRLLRRGMPFQFTCREAESKVEVYFTPQVMRLHLSGPRRTHSTTRYLKIRRAISSGRLDQARETARLERRNLDRVLLEDGYVTREQWIKAVKDKAVSGLFSIFGWSDPYLETAGGVVPPPPVEEVNGLVCEIPLSPALKESLRRDLLRWKVLLKEIPAPDVVCIATDQSPGHAPRRAHDLFNGRRTVGDLIQLARVAPLELVRFVYDSLKAGKVRALTDREHYERIERRTKKEALEEAVVYLKSAIAWGYAPKLYAQRLKEVRRLLQNRPDSESRPVLQGEVATFSLAEILQLLHAGQRSGTLKVSDGEREKVLYLDRGDVHVLRVDQSESDQEVWDLLLGDETRSSLNLTELLKTRGLLDESQVGGEELNAIKEDIFDAFLWDGATYEFTQNLLPSELREESDRATTVKLNTPMLLMQAMSRLAEWDELRQVLKSSRAVFAYASPKHQLDAVREGLGAVAYLYDGKHSLLEIVRVSGENRFKVYRDAAGLVQRGCLQFKGIKKVQPRERRQQPLASGRLPQLHPAPQLTSSSFEGDGMINSDVDMPPYLGDSMEGL
ncbi:MAG: DUF4388 domain-containing protein [Planctomycetota bacterium]